MANPALADVHSAAIADVTPVAFSVVWVSDEPIVSSSDVSVTVFEDFNGDGLADGPAISAALDISVASGAGALERGLVKVDVAGVGADQTYLVTTTTSTASGTINFPTLPTAPMTVHTALQTTAAQASGLAIVNDVLVEPIRNPDGSVPVAGSILVLVRVPNVSQYPLSAFVGDGVESPNVLVNMANLYDDAAGSNIELPAGTVIEMQVYRGNQCAAGTHIATHFRRAPAQTESPPAVTVSEPERCFFANTRCDNIIDIVDAQRVFDQFLVSEGSCRYNEDLDLNEDGIIDIVDAQQIFDRFLDQPPFE